jgi:hypothetical protein
MPCALTARRPNDLEPVHYRMALQVLRPTLPGGKAVESRGLGRTKRVFGVRMPRWLCKPTEHLCKPNGSPKRERKARRSVCILSLTKDNFRGIVYPQMGRSVARCPDGSWSASEVADRLQLSKERVKTILRALAHEEFGTGRGRFRCFMPHDVVTILVADRLISEGVRPSRVRDACRYLREKLRAIGPPLTQYTLFTDGRSVLVSTEDSETVVDVSAQGQLVFALTLHDIAIACERAGFLSPAQPRLARVEASVTLRWPTSEPPEALSGGAA